MVRTYDGLHQIVSSAIETYLKENETKSISFEIADNGSCSMFYAENGNKMTFMLAKFSDEYKVGFAFFEGGESQPDWLDDVFNTEFKEAFVINLITEQLLEQEI